jgi:hypothetical protein
LITVFLHILLFWVVPWELSPSASSGNRWTQDVEYAFDDAEQEEARYVEANPEAPSNLPDDTVNFSNRDQQASQIEDSPVSESRMPYLEGEEEDTTKIVEADFSQQASPPVVARDASRDRREERDAIPFLPPVQPLRTHVLEQEAVGKEGLASMLDKPEDTDEEVEEVEEEPEEIPLTLDIFQIRQHAEEAVEAETVSEPTPPADVQMPRPRPRLMPRAIPGPLMRSRGRAMVGGIIAHNAKFNDFGDYLARMFEAISQQFHLSASESEAVDGEIATRVVVVYSLTPDGEASEVTVKHTTAGSVATLICKDAIQSTSPFGTWTLEMMETLESVEPVEITFLYR